MNLNHAQDIEAIVSNLSRIIQGKDEKIKLFVYAFIAGGHILIEDIPGVGKTTLARALATTINGHFSRIQFTPDLLPSDITGINVYQPSSGDFIFRKGPIFANIVLADEINRASARTQSALLEAMSDEHVTIDGKTMPLPKPFIVLATQNPIEYHGTYALPEAQLDRFTLQIDLGYPPIAIERSLIMERTSVDPVQSLQPVISLDALYNMRLLVDRVAIDGSISDYLLNIVSLTRTHEDIHLGVSTRGTLLYARIARARALSEGRNFVIPEDVKSLAVAALSHRIVLKDKAKYNGVLASQIINSILTQIPTPR